MLSLKDKKWKVFPFIEIFDIKKGFYNKKPKEDSNGKIPFLGATDSNNGVTEFLTLNNIKESSKTGNLSNVSLNEKIFPGKAICVTNNGSVGHAYYQASKFTCSHDINPLYLKNYVLNKSLALFLISSIERQGKLFQYGRKWRPLRMIRSKLKLPVDKNNNPDYKYMELYVDNIKKDKVDKYYHYILNILSRLQYKSIVNLNEKEWKSFFISDIFDVIKRGKRLKNSDHISGKIPYISSTSINNGVDDFIKPSLKTRIFHNCISLANSGSVGKAFFEPFNFVASDHITSLHKNIANKYVYLFLVSSLEKQRSNFNFNREINDSRIKKLRIMLPVSKDNNPDYRYMEQYIKNIMINKYKSVSKYIIKD